MRQVRLGQTELQVSAVAFGTWVFGGDWGAAERLLGAALRDRVRREEVGVDELEQLREFGRLEALQPPYHLFRRDIEDEVLPYTAKHDIGVLGYGPIAHGLLSGRMTPATTFAPDDWRSKSPDFTGERFRSDEDLGEIDAILAAALPVWGPHPEG